MHRHRAACLKKSPGHQTESQWFLEVPRPRFGYGRAGSSVWTPFCVALGADRFSDTLVTQEEVSEVLR